MSGEAASRADIRIPEAQRQLLKALVETKKQVILLVMSGRPLDLSYEHNVTEAILQTWFAGTEAGNAIAELIFGQYTPNGKLPVTFPRAVGQVPIFYSHLNSGRPQNPKELDVKYVSRYLDIPNDPLYEFGYGLSYTTFTHSNMKLNATQFNKESDVIQISITISNTGDYDGYEIVQLYTRDLVGSVARPVAELKDF